MSLNVATRVLPYALLLFVGVAGWTMGSTALLSIDVVGIVAVAIGTSFSAKSAVGGDQGARESRPLL